MKGTNVPGQLKATLIFQLEFYVLLINAKQSEFKQLLVYYIIITSLVSSWPNLKQNLITYIHIRILLYYSWTDATKCSLDLLLHVCICLVLAFSPKLPYCEPLCHVLSHNSSLYFNHLLVFSFHCGRFGAHWKEAFCGSVELQHNPRPLAAATDNRKYMCSCTYAASQFMSPRHTLVLLPSKSSQGRFAAFIDQWSNSIFFCMSSSIWEIVEHLICTCHLTHFLSIENLINYCSFLQYVIVLVHVFYVVMFYLTGLEIANPLVLLMFRDIKTRLQYRLYLRGFELRPDGLQ